MKRALVALAILLCIAIGIAVVLPSASTVQAGNAGAVKQAEDGTKDGAEATAEDAADTAKAAEYCVKKGGEVDVREPYFNTNDIEQNWFQLSGTRQFCKFTNKDTSRIHVLLTTLYSKTPTLAALAYYAEVPYNNPTCNGNPASCYCSQLGGTDLFGGININGGGWVLKSDPVDTVLEACIFPDMSTIDSWGLTYHQAGIIRGRNLANVLRYPNPYVTK